MSVSTTNAVSGPFITNGATTVFPFTFTAPSASEVSVILRDAGGNDTTVSRSTYTTSLVSGGGGSVTFDVAPASGSSLYLLLEPDFTQGTEFEEGSRYLASAHNAALDRAALRDQWLKARVEALYPEGILGGGGASQFLAFDSDGRPVLSSGTGADAGLRGDLGSSAADKGAALVRLEDGTTAQERLDALRSAAGALSAFGPVDTPTEALATLTDALASDSPRLIADQDIDIGTATVPNTEGKPFAGGDKLIYWDAGDGQGKQVYNRRGRDAYQQFYGREYLAAWYAFLDVTDATTTATVTLTGDSITESYVGPMLTGLLNRLPNVTASNWGISSSTVEQWRRGISFFGAGGAGEGKALADVMAAPPTLLTMAWPTNTPYYGGTDYADPSAHTGSPADAAWSLDQALTTIRATYDASEMSICIILPPASSDGGAMGTEGGWKRDEFFVAKCREAIMPLVEKHKVALFDQSFETPDASVDIGTTFANFWHRDGVHPTQGHLRLLANKLFDFLAPPGFRFDYGIIAPPGLKRLITASTAPSFFPVGISIDRATTGFPMDGFVETVVAADGFPRQTNYGFGGQTYEYVRYSSGSPAAWGAWTIQGRGTQRATLTPATGFTLSGDPDQAASVVSGGYGLLTGWLTMTTPGVLAVGTTLATITDTAARPKNFEWLLPAFTLAGDGSSFEEFRVSLNPDGTVKVAKATTGSLPRVYFNTGAYEAA